MNTPSLRPPRRLAHLHEHAADPSSNDCTAFGLSMNMLQTPRHREAAGRGDPCSCRVAQAPRNDDGGSWSVCGIAPNAENSRSPRRQLVGALLCLAATGVCAQNDADASNHFHGYSNEKLEQVCAAMSPSSYASGLSEGTWLALPGSGKTYYYKSACYFELARRTGRADVCQKVKERKTLLGDGSTYSQASCERMLAGNRATAIQQQSEADAHAAIVQGSFKLCSADASTLPEGNWRVSIQACGSLSGSYRFEVVSLKDQRILVAQTVKIAENSSHSWTIDRKQLVGNTPLPAIFPLAVSLWYMLPPNSAYPIKEHLSSIRNLTLSAQ
jgi:hypothetical protein